MLFYGINIELNKVAASQNLQPRRIAVRTDSPGLVDTLVSVQSAQETSRCRIS